MDFHDFNIWGILRFEVTKRTIVMSVEINFDLLECGSNTSQLVINCAHLPQIQLVRTNILQGIHCPLIGEFKPPGL